MTKEQDALQALNRIEETLVVVVNDFGISHEAVMWEDIDTIRKALTAPPVDVYKIGEQFIEERALTLSNEQLDVLGGFCHYLKEKGLLKEGKE